MQGRWVAFVPAWIPPSQPAQQAHLLTVIWRVQDDLARGVCDAAEAAAAGVAAQRCHPLSLASSSRSRRPPTCGNHGSLPQVALAAAVLLEVGNA